MPVLSNQRHERFACLLAEGKSAREAYSLSGYRDNRHNAARLKANEVVAARVFELQQAAADGCKISIQSVCKELDEAIALAKVRKQPNALVSAAGLRAKLGGLLIEKQEVAITNVDPYEDMHTAAEVLAKVVEELGERAARALAEAFEFPFDETIMAVSNSPNGAQRTLEWQPPRKARRREVG